MSRTHSKTPSLQLEEPLYLVTAMKDYTSSNAQELSIECDEILFVMEEGECFHKCYSKRLGVKGFVPKNFLKELQPLPVLVGTVNCDPEDEIDYLDVEEGDRVLICAVIDVKTGFGKKINRDGGFGQVALDTLDVDGDISVLPTYRAFKERSDAEMMQVNEGGRSRTISSDWKMRSRAMSGEAGPRKGRTTSFSMMKKAFGSFKE